MRMRKILIFTLILASCTTPRTRVQPLASIQKPVVANTAAMGANIAELEKALGKVSSRAERIKLLIDAIE